MEDGHFKQNTHTHTHTTSPEDQLQLSEGINTVAQRDAETISVLMPPVFIALSLLSRF